MAGFYEDSGQGGGGGGAGGVAPPLEGGIGLSLVNNRYRILRRLGGGGFGDIYEGVGPKDEQVAIKYEKQDTRHPQLRHEFKVYRELRGCEGIASIHWYHFGKEDNDNVMVMDLLGPSLEDLFNKCSRRFSLKTVLQIADQLLERIDTLHSRHLLHRDIKPDNFVIGKGRKSDTVFSVDFGMSKRFRDPITYVHIRKRRDRSLTGTPRYASINNHLGIEMSRRDDLESIAYVLIYLIKGSLPWQGLKATTKEKKYQVILQKKQIVPISILCHDLPPQFGDFLAYTRDLEFEQDPDYNLCRRLFRVAAAHAKIDLTDTTWDWESLGTA